MPGGFVCSGRSRATSAPARSSGTCTASAPLRKLFTKEQRAFFAEHAPGGLGARRSARARADLRPQAQVRSPRTSAAASSPSCGSTPTGRASSSCRRVRDHRGVPGRGRDAGLPHRARRRPAGEQQTKTRTALEFFARELAGAAPADAAPAALSATPPRTRAARRGRPRRSPRCRRGLGPQERDGQREGPDDEDDGDREREVVAARQRGDAESPAARRSLGARRRQRREHRQAERGADLLRRLEQARGEAGLARRRAGHRERSSARGTRARRRCRAAPSRAAGRARSRRPPARARTAGAPRPRARGPEAASPGRRSA